MISWEEEEEKEGGHTKEPTDNPGSNGNGGRTHDHNDIVPYWSTP